MPAGGHGHQLHASADAQHGQPELLCCAERGDLAGVPVGPDAESLLVRVGAVQRRVEVGATGEEQPVERPEHLAGVGGVGRDHDHESAGRLDLLDVGVRAPERLRLSHTPQRACST